MMAAPYIKKIVDESVEPAITDIGQDAIHTLKEKIDIQKIVENKINELDLAELERKTFTYFFHFSLYFCYNIFTDLNKEERKNDINKKNT